MTFTDQELKRFDEELPKLKEMLIKISHLSAQNYGKLGWENIVSGGALDIHLFYTKLLKAHNKHLLERVKEINKDIDYDLSRFFQDNARNITRRDQLILDILKKNMKILMKDLQRAKLKEIGGTPDRFPEAKQTIPDHITASGKLVPLTGSGITISEVVYKLNEVIEVLNKK